MDDRDRVPPRYPPLQVIEPDPIMQERASPLGSAMVYVGATAIVVLALFNGTRGLFTGWLKGLTMMALAPLFAPAIQGFLISAFALDPADLAGRVEKPILIVQGDRDIQVGVPDAKALKEAAPTAELAVIPDVNHILKVVSSDDTAANIATYADPALPLAPRVIETIEDFLKRQPAADPL